MPKRDKKTSHGDEQFFLMALRNGPLTREEINNIYSRFGGLFGISSPVPGTRKYQKWQREIDRSLDHLLELGLIVKNEGEVYRLTEQGIEEADILDRGLEKFTGRLRGLLSSEKTTARVSIIVNALLSALKLGVGLLFNSMALVADGFDNAVDVVSAIVVFLGIKYRRELVSTLFIVVVMFATGAWVGYESIARLIHPQTVETGVLAIAAAVISGLVCYLMSLYQYTVGKNRGSLSLISQSIDSKNHVFVAGAVLIGIILAKFGVFIVDSIVGLVVAGMILKSATGLAIETSKIAGGQELDLSRFTRAEERAFENRRRDYFKSWLLFSLREVNTREKIVSRYRKNFSTEGLPLIDHFDFIKGFDFENHVDALLEELVDEGLTTVQDMDYRLTDKGNRLLKRKLASQRYM
jgi:cation diffusion facilitator family transporter